jgi:hypothetical protein
MSFFRNTIHRPSLPISAGLSRLLLHCHFDFQHKVWSLPDFDNPQDAETTFAFFARGLLPATAASAIHFSDPAQGGSKPNKLTPGRIGFRSRRLLGKTTTTNQKKK